MKTDILKMKYNLIIILVFTIISCKDKTQETISVTSESKEVSKVEHIKIDQRISSTSKVAIDFDKNKDILDIILLLPDSTFSSWEWKLEDRIKWYNEIKENDYYTDDNPNYFNQKYFEPNKVGFSIVDGFWSINIYKTLENSYIVITDDVAGDGNSLNFYEVKS